MAISQERAEKVRSQKKEKQTNETPIISFLRIQNLEQLNWVILAPGAS